MAYVYRCPDCRTRRVSPALFSRHLQTSGHTLCKCCGYHYAHRPRSPYCELNPMCAVNRAYRDGAGTADLQDIHEWEVFARPGRASSAPCPF